MSKHKAGANVVSNQLKKMVHHMCHKIGPSYHLSHFWTNLNRNEKIRLNCHLVALPHTYTETEWSLALKCKYTLF